MGSSVEEFRARAKASGPISVPIAGTSLTIDCQRPPLFDLAINGLVVWPALLSVRAALEGTTPAAVVDPALDNRPTLTAVDKAAAYVEFIDEWACACAVSPPVKRWANDGAVLKGDAICVESIPFDSRVAMWMATMPDANPAVTSFRSEVVDGAAGGSGGAEIRTAAVSDAGSDGPGTGAGDGRLDRGTGASGSVGVGEAGG